MRCHLLLFIFFTATFLPSGADGQDYYDDPVPDVELPGWGEQECLEANAARDADYLSPEEKKVYFYLNLVRMDPPLFAGTYLDYLKKSTDPYESSLYRELLKLKPMPLLRPSRALFESAQCHATESGEYGYTGHERFKCEGNFLGECCHYGNSGALDIVIKLLIDRNVASLGHRRICFGNYTTLGVSIRPHATYGKNAVLDFE